jgi:hypothetical protein
MKRLFILSAFVLASPAQAQGEIEDGFRSALIGCEEWILNPASWSAGVGPFVSKVGLGTKMGLVQHVDDVNLPPVGLRQGNRYWRINSTPKAGYVLVVSDQLPMCHLTGGGDTDLQPVVEAMIASSWFKSRWEQQEGSTNQGMRSTLFRNREDPALSMKISRADKVGQRLDRVQIIATATYKVGK